MRKYFILIILSILVFTCVDAQTDTTYYKKGKFFVSAKLPSMHFGGGMIYIDLNVKPELFIVKQLSLTTDFGMTFNNLDFKYLYIQPTLNYYLLPKRFTPVISAGIRYEYTSYQDFISTRIYPVMGVGVSLMSKKGNFYAQTGIEVSAKKEGIEANFFPYLRLGFLINRKK